MSDKTREKRNESIYHSILLQLAKIRKKRNLGMPPCLIQGPRLVVNG